MSKPTMTGFLIAMLFISLVAVTFSVYLGEFNVHYPANYTDPEAMSKLSEINELSSNVQNKSQGITTGISPIDAASQVIAGAFSTMKLTYSSLTYSYEIQQSAIDDTPIGNSTIGATLRTFFVTLITITIILGVIVAAVLKWRI